MMRFVLILAMLGLALATIALLSDEHAPANAGLPVVKSSVATGCSLPNPCDRIDCSKAPPVHTAEIA